TMVGRSIDQAFVGPDLRDVVALAQRIQRGRAATVEQALQLRRNGARVSLLASGTTLRGPEGEYGGLLIAFDDLTELLRAQRLPGPAPRRTDARPIVEAVALLYRESHPRLVINTRAPGDLPLLDVDPDLFRRVIMNLVDNAVEAVGGAGHVDVELTHAEGAGRVRIVVSDTGPGIS